MHNNNNNNTKSNTIPQKQPFLQDIKDCFKQLGFPSVVEFTRYRKNVEKQTGKKLKGVYRYGPRTTKINIELFLSNFS